MQASAEFLLSYLKFENAPCENVVPCHVKIITSYKHLAEAIT
jgi:hypothetical protein